MAGDGAGLKPVEPGTPAWDRLRKEFPVFSAETLGQLDCVSSPDLYDAAPGFVERDGTGQPVGVAFRLPGGRNRRHTRQYRTAFRLRLSAR